MVRRVRAEASADVKRDRSPVQQANIEAFEKWLDGVTLTKPVSLADKIELKALVKQALLAIEVRVDVYSRRDPDEVYVRVEYPDGNVTEKTFHAV